MKEKKTFENFKKLPVMWHTGPRRRHILVRSAVDSSGMVNRQKGDRMIMANPLINIWVNHTKEITVKKSDGVLAFRRNSDQWFSLVKIIRDMDVPLQTELGDRSMGTRPSHTHRNNKNLSLSAVALKDRKQVLCQVFFKLTPGIVVRKKVLFPA